MGARAHRTEEPRPGENRDQRSHWRRTFLALQERDFAIYFAGNTSFFMAMQMNLVLRGYLAVEITGEATSIGIVSIGAGLPMLVIAPIGGVLADRMNRRTLLTIAQVFVSFVNLALAVLIIAGLLEFWHLVVGAAGSGAAIATVMPARQAIVPQLVPQHRLMNAISLQMAGMNLTRIIGPAMGGVLIAPLGGGVAGAGGVYVITVGLFLLSTLTVLALPSAGMRARPEEGAEEEPFVQRLAGGFGFIAREPLFRVLLGTALVMPFFALPVQQILPVFSEQVFDRGPSALGLLMAATGLGGIIGALATANLEEYERKNRLMLLGVVVMGGSFFAFAVSDVFWVALLFLTIGSVGRMLFMVTNNTVIQARVPDAYRGRVMSVLMMSFGAQPLGVLPLTIAADAIGPQAAVAGLSVLVLVVMLGVFTMSTTLRNLTLSPLAHAELSPSQAARLVEEGRITQEEADRITGRDSEAIPAR